jgi:hypothetical protein
MQPMKANPIHQIVGLRLAVGFLGEHDQPAKAEVEVGINSSQMMANAKDLPVAHYEDYALVFTSPPALQDGTR